MRTTNFQYAVSEINKHLEDAKRMYEKIANDPRRKLDQPNEKLHYWDGRVTAFRLAADTLSRVELPKKGWDQ